MVTQKSMFDDVPDKTGKEKQAKPQQTAMFSPEDMTGRAKHSDITGGWRGKMGLEREDPRSEEQKADDEQRKAESRMGLIFDWTYYEQQAHYHQSRCFWWAAQYEGDFVERSGYPFCEAYTHARRAETYYRLAALAKWKAGLSQYLPD